MTEPEREKILRFQEGDALKNYRFLSRPEPGEQRAGGHRGRNIQALGEGGSGVVFLAAQSLYERIEVQRAIKFFMYRDDIAHLSAHGTPISKDDFLAEIVNISSINHESLVKVIDAGMHAVDALEIPYIVTEYVGGPTLREVLEHRAAPGILETWQQDDGAPVLKLLLSIGEAICYLHSIGFAHCDIAPKNIFLKETESYRPVLGDLGLAKNVGRPREDVLIAGTRSYMPPEALSSLNKNVAWEEFVALHPRWDMWSFAKTGLDLLTALNGAKAPKWRKALWTALEEAQAGKRYRSMQDLVERIHFLQPVHRQVAAVPELSTTITGKVRKLMPIQSFATSPRFRRIMQHPGLMRLSRVPQLSTTLFAFPAATHTRYEHSLGTMETIRRYLVALLDQEDFLEHLSVPKIEVALLCGLLSNATRFPLSNLIHEVKQQNESVLSRFSKKALLEDIFAMRDNKGRTLPEIIAEDFPSVSLDDLHRILLANKSEFGPDDQLIYSLLNSSLDARVIDFVRRDSLHVGIHEGYAVDLEELLPHLTVHEHKLALQVTGVTVAEQIIALRYWLFNRIYWCRPNRAFVAMVRHLMMDLLADDAALERIRSVVLHVDQREFLRLLKEEAQATGRKDLISLSMLLTQEQQDFYRVVFDESPAEAQSLAPIWRQIDRMGHAELKALGADMTKAVLSGSALQRAADIVPLLIDLPQEPGPTKLGDDIMVLNRGRYVGGLKGISGIVRGVNNSFNEHLRRLRVFLHPELMPIGDEHKSRLEQAITDYLRANLT